MSSIVSVRSFGSLDEALGARVYQPPGRRPGDRSPSVHRAVPTLDSMKLPRRSRAANLRGQQSPPTISARPRFGPPMSKLPETRRSDTDMVGTMLEQFVRDV